MKILKRTLLGLMVLVLLFIAGSLAYLRFAFPKVADAPDLTVDVTPDRVARGEYLAHNVTGCIGCHSSRDWDRYGGPIVHEAVGNDYEFTTDFAFPGNYTAPNLTPAGIGDWTDGELYRAITAGVSRDGRPLFPIMPYLDFGKMDPEDIYSIIAYLRTLDPVESELKPTRNNFPMSLIVRTMPKEQEPQPLPGPDDRLAYGKYMFNAAGCQGCHTPMVQGRPDAEMANAGGMPFILPTGGVVYASNITPHESTGIGTWTEDQFVAAFKAYADSSYSPGPVAAGEKNTYMPWLFYCHMEETDLRAIYNYIRTLDPIEHQVAPFTAEATAQR